MATYFYRWDKVEFPRLCDLNHHIELPQTRRYNCIAWAAGDNQNWWWPIGAYWPPGVPRERTIDAFVAAFGTRGYSRCNDPSFEVGLEKVALYEGLDNGVIAPTHAARQLRDGGCWASKMGQNFGIEHLGLDAVGGGLYGHPVAYLSRAT